MQGERLQLSETVSGRDLATARRRLQLRLTKSLFGCENCGYNEDPRALEFHHRDASEKAFDIGANRRASESRVVAEIQKCLLLCANCHRTQEAELV